MWDGHVCVKVRGLMGLVLSSYWPCGCQGSSLGCHIGWQAPLPLSPVGPVFKNVCVWYVSVCVHVEARGLYCMCFISVYLILLGQSFLLNVGAYWASLYFPSANYRCRPWHPILCNDPWRSTPDCHACTASTSAGEQTIISTLSVLLFITLVLP